MWSASALLGLRCPLLLYWSLIPHAGQCVMPMACARASTCFLNCLCSRVLVLLTAFPPFCSLLFSLFSFVFVLGGGASQRQRDERLHRLTLLFLLLAPRFSFFLFSLVLRSGVCRVVRAQLCEHARNTTHALCSGFGLFSVVYVFLIATCVVHTTHCSLLTVTVLNIEHRVLLITS